MIRNGKTIREVRRNNKVIKEAYRNGKRVWSSGPNLINWARLDPANMLANSGTSGGSFTQIGSISSRSPYGAYFNSSSRISRPMVHSTKGYTIAGWIKASAKKDVAASPLAIEGRDIASFIRISQETVNLKYILAEVSLAGQSGTAMQKIDTSKFAGVGEWLHVALSISFVYEGTWAGQAKCELVINGRLSLEWYAVANNAAFTTATMAVGGSRDGAWEGDIGSARAYDDALSLADIRAIYESERSIYKHPEIMPVDHIMRWVEPNFLLDYAVDTSTNSGSSNSSLVATSGSISWVKGTNNYARYRGRQTYSPAQRSNNSSPSCTMGCWVNVPSGVSGGREVAHWVSSDNRYEMYISCDPGNGNPYMGAKVNNAWMDAWPATGRNIRNVWTHLVATVHRNSSGRMETHLYINGEKADNRAQGDAIPLAGSPSSTLYIGASAGNAHWDVYVDDFFITGELLDPGQIKVLYEAGRIPQ